MKILNNNISYYERNKERIKARNAKWKKDNPEKVAQHRLNCMPATKEWKKNNPDKMREYRKRYRSRESIEQKLKHTLKFYSITVEEYFLMQVFQENKCAICGVEPGKKRLAVDHNHITGKVRGLLCFRCNSTLGILKDNIEVLENMIKYLKTNG